MRINYKKWKLMLRKRKRDYWDKIICLKNYIKSMMIIIIIVNLELVIRVVIIDYQELMRKKHNKKKYWKKIIHQINWKLHIYKLKHLFMIINLHLLRYPIIMKKVVWFLRKIWKMRFAGSIRKSFRFNRISTRNWKLIVDNILLLTHIS